MSDHWLEIGGIYFGSIEGDEITQSYEDIPEGVFRGRLADGTQIVRSSFGAKVRTRITGKGVLPPGMDTLDMRGTSYLLKCVGYRTVSSATNSITLPGHRSDVPVIYSAWTSSGVLIPWDGSSVITGAKAYRATYVPEFTAHLVDKSVSGPYRGDNWSWELMFEEV